ncbi:MAG TPA: PilX N-terminal domain-containing pilus assembly protein [Candidatus Koribacter sp.]|jgi:Tfp pilus assembly protein PilX
MKTFKTHGAQRGIALLTVLLFLMLLSALAVGMMYMSTTDTQINANFRAEQTAYFAARAGLEEVRDRMRSASANSLNASLPTGAPGSGASSVLYVINQGTDSTTVQPWNASNKYFDTELCHEGTSLYTGTVPTADQPCTTAPSGTWYTSTTTALPLFSSTSAAIPYKWARLTLKVNSSNQNHYVDSSKTASSLVCYTGQYEQILTASSCASQWTASNPVYMITALAVTKDGGRKMLQGEVSLQPGGLFNYGLFATSSGCSAISLTGSVSTDSYTTAGGGTYSSTQTNTGGDVAAVGNISAGGNAASIGGSVGSVSFQGAAGSCTPGNPGASYAYTGSTGDIVTNTSNVVEQIPTQSTPTPEIPTGPTGGANVSGTQTLSPGKYGDISLNAATLTLKAGTYYVNSISTGGNAKIVLQGAVTIYLEGDGPSSSASPLDIEGNGQINAAGPPSNLLIEYAGTNGITISGTPTPALALYAPNAPVSLKGGGNGGIYGAIVGQTVSNNGNVSFHFDRNLRNQFPDASYFTLLGFRELYY